MKKEKLERCPFCGWAAEMEPWHGGGPEKVLVRCANEACAVQPGAIGGTPKEVARRWNTRHAAPKGLDVWLPIETAPKEPGQRVLLHERNGAIVIGTCHQFDDGSVEHMDGDDYTFPTHWMPLPESSDRRERGSAA